MKKEPGAEPGSPLLHVLRIRPLRKEHHTHENCWPNADQLHATWRIRSDQPAREATQEHQELRLSFFDTV